MSVASQIAARSAAHKDSTSVQPRNQINVVLFSGGSGTQSITEAFLRHRQISLKILINAYDDGHSTGRLRRFIPSMLGPSDVRKNINRLMPSAERSHKSLKLISDHRLPVGISRADALALIDRVLDGRYTELPAKIAPAFDQLTVGQYRTLSSYLRTFVKYFHEQESRGRTFDFTDCAIGNLLFAGCYLEQGEDFNRTIDVFSEFYEVKPGTLLNITLGENLFLVAEKENGSVLLNEADIVAAQDLAKISEIFLLDAETYHTMCAPGSSPPPGGWSSLFRERHRTPRMNPHATEALATADVIIYGPGTQHSSLFPSYLTEGVAEAISGNRSADKIFVGNIYRDFDIQADDANDLARKLVQSMARRGAVSVNWPEIVSHFFVHRAEANTLSQAKYVPFDADKFAFPLETVRARDWEAVEGKHSGGYVLDELQTIVQSRIDIELERVQHMLSVVVPVLNEEATIEDVLKSLLALDFEPLGLTKEIIVVDGGSSDRSAEIAQGMRNVRLYQLPSRLGRGAALRMGVEKARGNIIAFFPADAEYHADSLLSMVSSVVRSEAKAVFGTRVVKFVDLPAHLRQIYQNNRRLYLTSKYGGMALSILTLLLYNRYVSDVLTSIKVFDAQLLKTLALEGQGIDLDTEIIAKLSLHREYILELPVDFKARTREQGKKITPADGVKAMLALFKHRFRAV
jgi:2-phospho-L-lactate transferase/gluconeogenesis factor (CofD/UPF0052 family)